MLVIFTAAIAAELRDLNPPSSQLSPKLLPKFFQASISVMAGITIACEFHALNTVLMLQANQPLDLTALAKKPNVSPSTIVTLTV